MRAGLDQAIARGLSYAPFADMVWCETSEPNLSEAKRLPKAVKAKFPDKLLAYNCSPSFNWKKKLDSATIAKFQRELGAMGYKFQFVTLAGFHALNYSMFHLAHGYNERGMAAYSELQEAEFAAEARGYTATKHQREVGTGYFDDVAQVIAGGESFDHRFARLDRTRTVPLSEHPHVADQQPGFAGTRRLTDSRLAALCAETVQRRVPRIPGTVSRNHAPGA